MEDANQLVEEMATSLLGAVVLLGVLIGVTVHLLRRRRRAVNDWNQALAAVAPRLGLEVHPVPDGPHCARGRVGRRSVQIGPGLRTGPMTTQVMQIEVNGRDCGQLAMKSAAQSWPEGEPRPRAVRTPIGEPGFDAVVELWGASIPLRDALRASAELRSLLMAQAEAGAWLLHGRLRLQRQHFPTDAEAVQALVTPVLEMARALGQRRDAAPPVRWGLKEAQLKQAMAPLGPGTVKAEDRSLSWRGKVNGFPVCAGCDADGRVTLTVEVDNAFDGIDGLPSSVRAPLKQATPDDELVLHPGALELRFGDDLATLAKGPLAKQTRLLTRAARHIAALTRSRSSYPAPARITA